MSIDHKIKESPFPTPNGKVLGTNGFNALFSMNFWDLIGSKFTSVIKSFSHGGFLRETNHWFITLVSMKRKPQQSVKKLKHLLLILVSENQSAFIKMYFQSDNFLLARIYEKVL